MRKVLAFVAAAAVAALFWFLRGSSDATVLTAKDAQIAAMQETARVKDNLASQQAGELDARTASIKELQDKLKSTADLLAKAQSQLDFDKDELQRVKTADETIINSLKEDNNADIQVLKEQIDDKNEQIAQLNEKLVQTIADYESKLESMSNKVAPDEDVIEKIYPKDNGFEAQDLGAGFFSYQVFGAIKNPNNVQFPPQLPNQTPWKFGDGNSGIAANGSGYYLNGASNGDSDGTKSTSGQAASLEYAGSWFSQTIKLPAGTFSVSFDYEGRRDYMPANIIAVLIDGKEVFRAAPESCDHFEHVTTGTFTFNTKDDRELKFLACGSKDNISDYPTTFIDNVCINVIDPHKHASNKAADNAPNPQPTIKEGPSAPAGIPDVIQNLLSVTKAGRG